MIINYYEYLHNSQLRSIFNCVKKRLGIADSGKEDWISVDAKIAEVICFLKLEINSVCVFPLENTAAINNAQTSEHSFYPD